MRIELSLADWVGRLALSTTVVASVFLLLYGAFVLFDPEWPRAVGVWYPIVTVLVWPGAWVLTIIQTLLHLRLPAGTGYALVWLTSACTYSVALFLALSLFVSMRRSAR